MTKYAISKVHLEGAYSSIVELFPSFEKNYLNLKRIEFVCRRLGVPSIRFVQDLTEINDWRDLFNEDYLIDNISDASDCVREIRYVYPCGYTDIDKLTKKLKNDGIDNMIIVGKMASDCVVEAKELFQPHMSVSVVKDAIFDELAYYPSACRRLKSCSVTTKELLEKLRV